MGEMRLFQIRYDGESYWIEVEDFGRAIAVWRAWMSKAENDDYSEVFPESVTLVHEGMVIRG